MRSASKITPLSGHAGTGPTGARVTIAGREFPMTMSTSEVAELLGCSPDFLQREVGTGRLPLEPLRLGNRLRWPTMLVARSLSVELPGSA